MAFQLWKILKDQGFAPRDVRILKHKDTGDASMHEFLCNYSLVLNPMNTSTTIKVTGKSVREFLLIRKTKVH